MLASVCRNNPLAINQILSKEFEYIRINLQHELKLEWALTWLKILKPAPKDEIFSMGIHQWIELATFLVGL